MKKYLKFFIIIIAILFFICFNYIKYRIANNRRISFNMYFINNYEKEISGTEMASIINKYINENENNSILKDENGLYIDDKENYIEIQIKFKDNENTIKFEKIYNAGVSKFVNLYSDAKFKLKKVEFHNKSNRVKIAYYEEV